MRRKLKSHFTAFLVMILFICSLGVFSQSFAPKKAEALGPIIGPFIGAYAGKKTGEALGGGVRTAAEFAENISPENLAGAVMTGGFKLFATAMAWVSSAILLFLIWILNIISSILDAMINFSTHGLSNIMSGQTGSAIRKAWTTFRDLSNIGLVFILLYIAISTIIQAGSFQTKKLLGSVIIVALLINFSYFFGTVIIDISNLFAQSIKSTLDDKLGGEKIGEYFVKESAIGTTLETAASITKIKADSNLSAASQAAGEFDDQAKKTDNKGLVALTVEWVAGLTMASILYLIIIFVFLSAAILLITRVIMLIFLLVVSPVAFAGMILPQTKKMSDDWWEAIFSQSFFLPVFLLFLLITVELINGGILSATNDYTTQLSGEASGMQQTLETLVGPFVKYAILIGLLVGGLSVSRKMSVAGGATIGKVSGGISGGIGKATLVTAAFAGRNTVGRFANRFAESDRLKDWASRPHIGGTLSSFALKGMRGVADTNFDARDSRVFKGVASATGIGGDFGKATTGGYTKRVEDRAKNEQKFAKSLGSGDLSSTEQTQKAQLQKDIQEQEDAVKAAIAGGDYDIAQGEQKQVDQMKKDLAKLENKRQSNYADQLEGRFITRAGKRGVGGRWIGRKNTAAAKKIRDEYSKGKDKKAIDDLKSVLKGDGGGKKEE